MDAICNICNNIMETDKYSNNRGYKTYYSWCPYCGSISKLVLHNAKLLNGELDENKTPKYYKDTINRA